MPVGATLATAAATAGGAVLSSNAANKATKAATNASNANLDFAKGVYSDAQGNLNPTIHGGILAGNALSGLLGIGGDPAASRKAFDTFRNSTNYNFLLDQGTQAVKTANAPSFNSGATAKALLNYGQGIAGNALAGYEGLLAGQQTLGAQSAGALAGVGQGIGQQVANANNNAAGVAGSAGIFGANAQNNALTGLSKLFGQQQTASSFGGGGLDTSSQNVANLGAPGLEGLY